MKQSILRLLALVCFFVAGIAGIRWAVRDAVQSVFWPCGRPAIDCEAERASWDDGP